MLHVQDRDPQIPSPKRESVACSPAARLCLPASRLCPQRLGVSRPVPAQVPGGAAVTACPPAALAPLPSLHLPRMCTHLSLRGRPQAAFQRTPFLLWGPKLLLVNSSGTKVCAESKQADHSSRCRWAQPCSSCEGALQLPAQPFWSERPSRALLWAP